jgi:hypothetical protein
VIIVAALAQCFLFWGIRRILPRGVDAKILLPPERDRRPRGYQDLCPALDGLGTSYFSQRAFRAGELGQYSLISRSPSHAHSNFIEAWHDLVILGFVLTLGLPIAALRWSVSLVTRPGLIRPVQNRMMSQHGQELVLEPLRLPDRIEIGADRA